MTFAELERDVNALFFYYFHDIYNPSRDCAEELWNYFLEDALYLCATYVREHYDPIARKNQRLECIAYEFGNTLRPYDPVSSRACDFVGIGNHFDAIDWALEWLRDHGVPEKFPELDTILETAREMCENAAIETEN